MEDARFAWLLLGRLLILVESLGGFAFLFQDDCHVDLGLVVVRVDLKNFLISFLSFQTVAFLFINNSQIEQGCGVGFFIDGDLEVVNGFVHVFAELVEQHAHVKI